MKNENKEKDKIIILEKVLGQLFTICIYTLYKCCINKSMSYKLYILYRYKIYYLLLHVL